MYLQKLYLPLFFIYELEIGLLSLKTCWYYRKKINCPFVWIITV